MIDWSTCPAVERDPDRASGAWVFRDTRVPVAALFENLEDGATVSEFVAWFPGVRQEQVRAVLDHAAHSALAVQVRILFDQGAPNPLRHSLAGHDVSTAYEQGWSRLKNGELLKIAEESGYDVFVTTDTNLKHQQHLTSRRLGIVVLLSTSWPRMQRVLPSIIAAITAATAGSYTEVEISE